MAGSRWPGDFLCWNRELVNVSGWSLSERLHWPDMVRKKQTFFDGDGSAANW
jgi:hypothetical protein